MGSPVQREMSTWGWGQKPSDADLLATNGENYYSFSISCIFIFCPHSCILFGYVACQTMCVCVLLHERKVFQCKFHRNEV